MILEFYVNPEQTSSDIDKNRIKFFNGNRILLDVVFYIDEII
jgi:hypothetical protein